MNDFSRTSNLARSGRLSLPTPARRACGASLLAALALVLPARAALASVPSESVKFESTGSEQTFTVPAGVTSVHVNAIGQAGEEGIAGEFEYQPPGGDGAYVSGQVPVTPGEVLYVEVADRSFGGGAGSGEGGGSGGGASDVRTVSNTQLGSLESRLLVAAGGGGGGGAFEFGTGGRGGDAGAAGGEGIASERFDDEGFSEVAPGGAAGTLTGGGGVVYGCGGYGIEGMLGIGGEGAWGPIPESGGGGGGGGYYGGAGGGTTCGFDGPEEGAGGGGGGGSSYVSEDVEAPTIGLASAATAPSVTISYTTPATATPSTSAISFPGVQPQGTASGPQTVTLTNGGGTPLELSAITLEDSSPGLTTDHPEDFLVESAGCLGKLQFEASCQLNVRFAPQAQGQSTAVLKIAGDIGAGPTEIALSGTGGELPQGPTGPAGAAGSEGHEGQAGSAGAAGPSGHDGATGPVGPQGERGSQGVAGPQGERGPQGDPAVFECHNRQRDGKFKLACYVRILSGSKASRAAKAPSGAKVMLRKRGVVYAAGLVPAGRGAALVMRATRHVPAGRYQLVLVDSHGLTSSWVTVGR